MTERIVSILILTVGITALVDGRNHRARAIEEIAYARSIAPALVRQNLECRVFAWELAHMAGLPMPPRDEWLDTTVQEMSK